MESAILMTNIDYSTTADFMLESRRRCSVWSSRGDTFLPFGFAPEVGVVDVLGLWSPSPPISGRAR